MKNTPPQIVLIVFASSFQDSTHEGGRYPGLRHGSRCSPCLHPYSSRYPQQVLACVEGGATHRPGAFDACGEDLPRDFCAACDQAGRIPACPISRHAAPRDESSARSVTRFSPDFRTRCCAWTVNECSDDGDHASTIRVSLGPSQRVDESFLRLTLNKGKCHG
jgi:hypothetical protein